MLRKATKAATQGQISEVIYSWVGRESSSVKNVPQPELGSHSVCKEITLKTKSCTSIMTKITILTLKLNTCSTQKTLPLLILVRKTLDQPWAATIHGLTFPYKRSCPVLAIGILCFFFLFCCNVSSRWLPQQRCRITGNLCNKMYSIFWWCDRLQQ